MSVRRLLISLVSIAVLASTTAAAQNSATRDHKAVPAGSEGGADRVATAGLRLTGEERAWLDRHRTIRVAFDGYFPPYSFLNDDGQMEGLAVDVIQVLAARTGIAIELSPKAVWKDLYEAAQKRDVDVVATMGRQPEREEWFAFTRPYIFKSLVIVTNENTKTINRPEDLAGKQVALVAKYQYVKPLLERYPSIKPYYVDTMLDGLNAVAVGKADAVITFIGAGHYLKNKYQITNLKFAAVFERDRFTECIAVRKDWPELVVILNKALTSITDDEMEILRRRWIGPDPEPGIAARTVFMYLSVVLGIALVLVSGVTIWNRALKKQVGQKTKELHLELAERRKAENAMRESEARLRTLVQTIPDLVWLKDANGVYLACNSMFERFFGAREKDIIGKTDYDFVDKVLADFFREHDRKAMEADKPGRNEEWITFSDDGHRALMDTIKTSMYDASGNLIGVLGISRDITEHRKLEEQYLQAQKMEAIGQLASGIAHDFNNIMAAIINYAYLLKSRISEDDPVQSQIEQISSLSMKASEITRGLLAFSRKNIANLMPVNINSVILDMGKLLSKFIGEDIDIALRLSDKDLIIMADISHIEQIIINLATNARDAMPEGGSFTIETDVASIDDDFIHMHGFGTRGMYALLSVTDTGAGMAEETKQRIFEPFFTTKEVGKGTGLGLAIIYGIVKQHGGYINVYSEPGRGTTFKIYFHIVDAAVPGKEDITPSDLTGHSETILLAEDEETVRNSVKNILEQFGYRVIEAVNGDDAIEKYREHKGKIDLLLFDVIMPKKNGKEAYDEIKKITPEIKVIFTSGYSSEIIDKKGIIKDGFIHILKPLSPDKLLSTIKKVLQNG